MLTVGNHPFAHGNKRTGFVALNDFLEVNGYRLDVPDSGDFGRLIVDGLTRRFSEAVIAGLLRPDRVLK